MSSARVSQAMSPSTPRAIWSAPARGIVATPTTRACSCQAPAPAPEVLAITKNRKRSARSGLSPNERDKHIENEKPSCYFRHSLTLTQRVSLIQVAVCRTYPPPTVVGLFLNTLLSVSNSRIKGVMDGKLVFLRKHHTDAGSCCFLNQAWSVHLDRPRQWFRHGWMV